MIVKMGTVVVASKTPTMSRHECLLEGHFEVFPNEKILYQVELTRSGITYYPIDGVKSNKTVKYIHFGDVIGCRCRKSLDQKHANKAYITVFAYPLKKKLFSEKHVRYKNHITFARSSDSNFDGNRKIVEKWRRVILHLCQQLPVNKKDVDNCPVPPKVKFLVLVNPHSGPGKAMQIYQKQVAPMLDEADVHVKLIETEHAGHGTELMKSMNRKDYDGVVIVSGDGLIYEVINGLMNRDDWQDAIKTPIGCIPGGSGNALACSINYSAGESVQIEAVLHSTFILIKHRVIPMDLVLIQQPRQQIYSFLSLAWGLLADIDYESEQFRAIGEARFTLQAIRRIFSLRKYKCKLSFLPVSEYIPKASINNNTKNINMEGKNRRVSFQSLDNVAEQGGGDDFRIRSKSVPTKLFRGKSDPDEIMDDAENGEQLTDIRGSYISREFSEEVFEADGNEEDQGNEEIKFSLSTEEMDTSSSPPDKPMKESNSINSIQEVLKLSNVPGQKVPCILPPLNEPVPDNWVTIEDDFVTICGTYQTHLGSDVIMAPDARFSDGIIHLCIVRAGIQKGELIQLMGMLEKGTHIDHPSPHIELVKVLAFRLEPQGREGIIMVDGEKVDSDSLQAQVLPGLANLMAIQ
ncbi:sphingosine kinase 1-like isoform X2 [Ruditapes philippinarum]|uniref:sphingosine kinase 1-like isoform X2 n=1 Tax=Ruditapes philippinarum TaxID=129788 RepID=UPI00295C2C90|nr:sphingosine kinase 1-like isoform X2 [Ruditapes philippinarum]